MRTATHHQRARMVLMLATITRSRLCIDMRCRVRKHMFKYTYGDRMVIEGFSFRFGSVGQTQARTCWPLLTRSSLKRSFLSKSWMTASLDP